MLLRLLLRLLLPLLLRLLLPLLLPLLLRLLLHLLLHLLQHLLLPPVALGNSPKSFVSHRFHLTGLTHHSQPRLPCLEQPCRWGPAA